MPHVIVEYTTNLARVTDLRALLDALHAAALSSPIVPTDALRTRAEPRTDYRVADGHPDNAFLAIIARLGPGRTADEKHALLGLLLGAAELSLGPAAANVMLSVEYQEIDAEFRINKNNLRAVMAARQTSQEA